MRTLFSIALILLCPSLIGQQGNNDNLQKEWEELSGKIEYLKDLQPKEKWYPGYLPPALPEYYDGEEYQQDLLLDNVDRDELYNKRQVMDRQGAAGDAEVKKKIKDISKPKDAKEFEQRRLRAPRNTGDPIRLNVDILRILLYLIAAVILAILVYHLMRRIKLPTGKESNKLVNDVDLLDPEKHEEEELEKQLDIHLENKAYRHALRVYYLLLLKELIDKKLIRWKKEKTNYHYQSELAGSPYFEDFHFALYVFEKSWYGQYEISEKDYQEISPKINAFMQKLKHG
jgi:hypothetical protein